MSAFQVNDDFDAFSYDDYEDITFKPLEAPFDITLAPPNLTSDDAPDQYVALASALTAPHSDEGDETHGFFDARVQTINLTRLEDWYKGKQSAAAISALNGQREIIYGDTHTYESDDKELGWTADRSFLDLMVCVGRDIGLGAMLPNLEATHNYEFTLNLGSPFRQFTAKHIKLGFDPTGSMLWIGRSPSGEDVWLAFVKLEDLETEEEDLIRPKRSGSSTCLNTHQYRCTVMFLAYVLNHISFMDATVHDTYPDVTDKADFTFATNIL